MSLRRGRKREIDPESDSDLVEMVNRLIKYDDLEKTLCPKCENDLGGYNSVCVFCDNFSNFKSKE